MSTCLPQSDVIRWLPQMKRIDEPLMRLLCFPYAGGSKHAFATWPGSLPPWLDVRALQLPGRGARFHDAFIRRFSVLIDALMPCVAPLLDRPVALFGHSMGAVIAFEVARRMERRAAIPVHLYVSGCRAPQSPDFDLPPIGASDDELVADLRQLNGTPQEMLNAPERMQPFLPPLRADYELLHSYVFTAGPPLSCPVTVLLGADDERERADGGLDGWREHCAGPWATVTFPGDHFYLRSSAPSLLAHLNGSLSRAADALATVNRSGL